MPQKKSGEMGLQSPKPNGYRRSTSDFASPIALTVSPRRNSHGNLASVADRKKSRNSYLNKRRSREGAGDRKDHVRNSLFGNIDAVFGDEEITDAGDDAGVSFENENSYLKRLLLSPSGKASPSGRKPKKMNVDNCRLRRKKKPIKKPIPVPPLTANANKPLTKPAKVTPTKTPDKTIKNKVASSSSSANKKNLSEEQNEKRLSTDSVDTAPTEFSDSTDNDTLTAVTNSAASLSINTAAVATPPPVAEIDYTDVFQPFESCKVDVDFEAPSVERTRKVSFAVQAQQAFIVDLVSESADPSKEFQWEDLFYTEDELADQRHEAFLEMVGLDECAFD